MNRTKKYIYIGATLLIIALIILLVLTLKSKSNTEKKWKEAMENVKAYSDQYSNSEDRNKAFKLTIDQLKYSNDSIFKELDEARKNLKIKDSKLQNLQYVSSSFVKTDTIKLPGDTIFKDSQVNMDTLLFDEWYSIKIGLHYPSTIAVKPEFKSVKNIVVSAKKETVNPPKRFFLFRWFQKKQVVLNVDVIEKNPYMQKQNCRYVEIVR